MKNQQVPAIPFQAVDEDISQMVCPFCDAVPHMKRVDFGPGIPPTSTSGPGMIVQATCEAGHNWKLVFEDHSAGTWISVERLPDTRIGES